MQPRLSVVIPVYNRAGLIGETLASLEAQTSSDFEVIVVDDGSSDGSAEAARAWTARLGGPGRLRVVTQANAGPGAARNHGVSLARGAYIAFLDSDDLWLPWTAEVLGESLRQSRGAVFTASRPMEFRGAGETSAIARAPLSQRTFPTFAEAIAGVGSPMFGSCTAVVRREDFWAVGGFVSEHVHGEDMELALRIGSRGTYAMIEAPTLVAQRVHEGSAMASGHAATFRGMRLLIERELAGVYAGGNTRVRRRWLSRMVRAQLVRALWREQREEAWALYLRSVPLLISAGDVRTCVGYPCMHGFEMAGVRSRRLIAGAR